MIRDDGRIWYGQLQLGIDTRRVPWPGELFIIGAPDSRVLFADELLSEMVHYPHHVHRDVTFEPPAAGHSSHPACLDDAPWCYAGWILKIKTIDATHPFLVYVIDEYVPHLNAWYAAWPD